MFENAKWIARVDSEEMLPTPIMRKSFKLNGKVESAVLSACGLGLAEYYINGRKITEDVLITPFTKYDTTVLYSEFDVTDLLISGDNAIGVMLGNGCYCVDYPRWDVFKPSWMHHPKLILQLDIKLESGEIVQINSDRSWKAHKGFIVYNQTKRGEVCDARLEQNGWNDVGFDDSDWTDTFICRSPGGVLKKAVHPPIRITDEFEAVRISDTVYDIGWNISGWVKIKAKAQKGHTITIKYAECLDKDGKPAYDMLNTILGAETHSDTYIFKGDGVEEWAPRFAYHGFRYFEVINAPEEFEVVGLFVHTDLSQTGDFHCSDTLLNRLHKMTCMTTLSNVHGIVTDCPQREQNGWTGDALVSADQMLMNYDMNELYIKWLGDIFDHQRPSGQIPAIAPTGGWGYNWGTGPSFDSFVTRCPYLIYKYTGDRRAIEKYWNNMKLYMTFLNSMTDDYIQSFGLGDWRAPKDAQKTPVSLVDTSDYYATAYAMVKCAKIIGENYAEYETLANNIKTAYRNRFITNGLVNVETQTAIAVTLYHGLTEPEEIAKNAKKLNELVVNNGYHTMCGIFGNKAIFSALSDNGYAQTVYKMVTTPGMPGYAHWVESGMTTLCESWEMDESLNHHMFSEVDMWFYKYLAGIKISQKQIVVEPIFVKGITEVESHHYGISVHWNSNAVRVKTDKPLILKVDGKVYDVKDTIEVKRKEEMI